MITKLVLHNFTAFEVLNLEVSKGINIFIGENGIGKTHIMKVIYAAYRYACQCSEFQAALRYSKYSL